MNGTLIYRPRTPSRTSGIAMFLQTNWFKIAFLAVLAFVMHNNDASIHFSMGAPQIPPSQFTSGAVLTSYTTQQTLTPTTKRTIEPTTSATTTTEVPQVPITDNDAPLFLETEKVYGTQAKKTAKVTKKQKDSHAYVKRFKATAVSEMKKYGIPASITLAQGILESNAGASRLANNNNNHFGLKCFSKSCGKGHCSNYHDDDHKDFFRKFDTAWESYRAHSLLLTGKRYRHLSQLKRTDYKNWAKGLQKAGYATSPTYARDLVQIIEALDLHKYDS